MSLIFRDNIRQIIGELGVSISEFAEIIGEKASRLNDVLQGRQRPPFDLIEKIIGSLDVDANWLISGQFLPAAALMPTGQPPQKPILHFARIGCARVACLLTA